jgi:hypothetical protein
MGVGFLNVTVHVWEVGMGGGIVVVDWQWAVLTTETKKGRDVRKGGVGLAPEWNTWVGGVRYTPVFLPEPFPKFLVKSEQSRVADVKLLSEDAKFIPRSHTPH